MRFILLSYGILFFVWEKYFYCAAVINRLYLLYRVNTYYMVMNMKENQQEKNIFLSASMAESRPSLLDSLAHNGIARAVQAISQAYKGDEPIYCIDATAGNGHDTCFLAGIGNFVQGDFSVLACDVQKEALQSTRERLKFHGLQAELVHSGHENITGYLPKQCVLAGVMFNLGYLPRKDRKNDFIATKAETSVPAIANCCERLYPQGVISVHCYTGHAGGLEEYHAIHDFAAALDPKLWRVLCVSDVNREHTLEYLFFMEKLQIKQKRAVC